jgi:formate hydrogenlyase subunit 3/multisubunit Na+/H+ antiporter MnhD subunit
MVAFLTSLVITVGLTVAVMLYGKRRPVGTPITWGEAMFGSMVVFLIIFLIYGVVPHQWLAYADNELGWRKDKIVLGPGDVFDKALPFTLTYEAIRDFIAVGIYVVALGVQIALWAMWQNRGKSKPKEIPTSAFGRPLVKST